MFVDIWVDVMFLVTLSFSMIQPLSTSITISGDTRFYATTLVNMDNAIKLWCDAHLADSRSYRGSIPAGQPIACLSKRLEEQPPRPGLLVYQDGTACSASHAFGDVYQLDDGSYTVYMDGGQAEFQGDSSVGRGDIEVTSFTTLAHVVDHLSNYSGHDSNSCGDLMHQLMRPLSRDQWDDNVITRSWVGGMEVPHLALCQDCPKLAALIVMYAKA